MVSKRSVFSPATIVKAVFVMTVAGMSFYLPQSAIIPASSKATPAKAGEAMDIWWPVDGARMRGTQPFKVLLPNRSVEEYTVSWQVDRDRFNPMESNYEAWPHKEATVDLTGWTWKGNGPYLITFTAKDNSGNVLGERSVSIWADSDSTPIPSLSTTQASISKEPEIPAAASQPETVRTEPVVATMASEPAPVIRQAVTLASAPAPSPAPAEVEAWWPVDGASVSGLQPFKGLLKNAKIEEYDMFWQVDGGGLNLMPDNYTDWPHKETMTELSGWNWKGSGPYAVKFVAKSKNGQWLGEKTVNITVGSNGGPAPSATAATVFPQTNQTAPPAEAASIGAASAQGNPFAGAKLYVNPYGDAKKQAELWRSSRPADASLMDKLGAQPESFWMGGWNKDIKADTAKMVQAAKSQGALPVLVAYNIPYRDCGQHSAGGVASADAYRAWIRGIADGIGSEKAVMLLEPDALTLTDCLSGGQRSERFSLIKDAVSVFKSKGNVSVYLDAGHARWIDPNEMAQRLKSAGIDRADGFVLNVSNFITDSESISYGEKISSKTGGKHFLIDSGRNGNGTNGEWCNPWGRALGRKPTAATGHSLVDAFLWVKGPGGSDGWCNGGPSAGTWFPEYALQLVKNAGW